MSTAGSCWVAHQDLCSISFVNYSNKRVNDVVGTSEGLARKASWGILVLRTAVVRFHTVAFGQPAARNGLQARVHLSKLWVEAGDERLECKSQK
jgi:hypothetical protein